MSSLRHRGSALLLLALALTWVGALALHDPLAHAGDCEEHGSAETSERPSACWLFHHAQADQAIVAPTPAPAVACLGEAHLAPVAQTPLPAPRCVRDRGPPVSA